jgi:hypothetical protein
MILDFGFRILDLVETAQSKILNPQSKMISSAFRLPDLVPQFRGPFVILNLNRPRKLLAKLGQIRAALGGNSRATLALGNFPDVMRRPFVGALNQWREVFLENRIVMFAPEQPALPELGPGRATILAGASGCFFLHPAVSQNKIREQLIDRRVCFNGQAFVLRSALLAEVFFDLLPVLDFGEVHRGRVVTVVALHFCHRRLPNRISRSGLGQFNHFGE